MPELPEVETVRRGLAMLVVGRKLSDVSHDTPRSFPNAENDVGEFLIGATITSVRRRAKVLLIDLDTEYTLVTHLKMTGQLVWIDDTSRKASFRGRGEGGEFTSPPSGGRSEERRVGNGGVSTCKSRW